MQSFVFEEHLVPTLYVPYCDRFYVLGDLVPCSD